MKKSSNKLMNKIGIVVILCLWVLLISSIPLILPTALPEVWWLLIILSIPFSVYIGMRAAKAWDKLKISS